MAAMRVSVPAPLGPAAARALRAFGEVARAVGLGFARGGGGEGVLSWLFGSGGGVEDALCCQLGSAVGGRKHVV